ncbi:isocitrate lyase/phosphoenolpyruvate mutase family protein [Nocardia sp. NPDC059228]|uniref:isocitrate lyase/phosphoenolpyruvate mutase family protein n=1 Tax=Nocardia sp. NPDC059228 TaxID=3346777 RepID=UPI003674C393
MLDLPVPPVSPGEHGVAWLRAQVARFSEGDEHSRRRAIVERELAAVDAVALRRGRGHHVAELAAALGVRVSVADVELVAECYRPHRPVSAAADAAVDRLVAAFGGVADEVTANRIGILVQACVATSALIAGDNPPVPGTRRVGAGGELVEVDLTGQPFGAGRHACPGRAHALALAAAAGRFHQLHYQDTPLLLPNVWDFATAAALVADGYPAIGTTSLGVAAAHGLPDAAGSTLNETLTLAAALVRLPVPVTVDIESGFGADPRELAARLWELGVAGVNVEDAAGDPGAHADLVRALKDGAPGLFVNARVDTYWLDRDHDTTRDRAHRYVDAGADGIFVPGLTRDDDIAALVEAIPVPLNVLAQRPLADLARLGVQRVSTGSLLYRAALDAALTAARTVRDGGRIEPATSYGAIGALIPAPPDPAATPGNADRP